MLFLLIGFKMQCYKSFFDILDLTRQPYDHANGQCKVAETTLYGVDKVLDAIDGTDMCLQKCVKWIAFHGYNTYTCKYSKTLMETHDGSGFHCAFSTSLPEPDYSSHEAVDDICWSVNHQPILSSDGIISSIVDNN